MGPSLAARNEPGGEHGVTGSAPTQATVIPLRPGNAGTGDEQVTDHQVAAWWESVFVRQGRTLADEATAEVHRITAATFGLLIDGARAQGMLSEEQAAYMSGLAVEAVRAPDFLPRSK